MEDNQLWLKSEDSIDRSKQSICLRYINESMAKFWSDWLQLFEVDGANEIL